MVALAQPLRRLTKLEVLGLANNQIGDIGLGALVKVKAKPRFGCLNARNTLRVGWWQGQPWGAAHKLSSPSPLRVVVCEYP